MREICLKNQRLQKILSGITDSVFEQNNLETIMKRCEDLSDNLITDSHPASDEYFHKAKNDYTVEQFGFPRAKNFGQLNDIEEIEKPIRRLQKTLGARSKALSVLYPKDGFIGWHHNGNAPGHNILFSYSTNGNGHFKYYDYDKSEIVYMYDKPGWNVKCGYYPDELKEPDRVYWHAAATEEPRISVAFIVPHREMWISMIDYITDGDYDKDYLKSQGEYEVLKSEGYV